MAADVFLEVPGRRTLADEEHEPLYLSVPILGGTGPKLGQLTILGFCQLRHSVGNSKKFSATLRYATKLISLQNEARGNPVQRQEVLVATLEGIGFAIKLCPRRDAEWFNRQRGSTNIAVNFRRHAPRNHNHQLSGVIALDRQSRTVAASADSARIAERRQRVDTFVRRHYGIVGSLRLHRAALGLDLLRAPVNVALAPVFLLSRLVALAASVLGLKRIAGWILRRRILLKSGIARAVEARIRAELLDRPAATESPQGSLPDRQQRLLEDYLSVRTAVSEIATTLIVIAAGLAIFRSLTPGMVSLTPMVSDFVARTTAISDFALGERLGALWYGVFPARLPVRHVIAIGVALAMVASLVTTFAGILADPIQAALGIHRRRLMRLLAALDAADGKTSPLAREHLLARAADISDASVSLIRFFRP